MSSWQIAQRQTNPPPYRGQSTYNERTAPNRSPLVEYRRMRIGHPASTRADKHKPLAAASEDSERSLGAKTNVSRWSETEILCKSIVRVLDKTAASPREDRSSMETHRHVWSQLNKQTVGLVPDSMSTCLNRLLGCYEDVAFKFSVEYSTRVKLERRIAALEQQVRDLRHQVQREEDLEKAAQTDPSSPGFRVEPSPLPNFFRRWKAQSLMDRDSGCSSASREPLPLPTPQDVMAIFALLTPLEQRDVRHMMSEVIPPVTPWRLETNPSDTVREARKKIAYGEHLHDLARASISMQLMSMEPSLAKSPEGRKLQRLHQMQQQQQLEQEQASGSMSAR